MAPHTTSAPEHNDQGLSIPLVLGAMMAFSAITILLAGIAHLSIKHNSIAQDRNRAFGVVEAGANDFLNRLNAYPDLVQWNARRVKQERAKQVPNIPVIVNDAAFAQWVHTTPGSDEAYTYDLLSQDYLGIVIRVTGRPNVHSAIRRSVEYRITRKTRGSVSVAVERPYANAAGYAYINQFREIGDGQGQMAKQANGSFLSVSDYERICDNHTSTDPAALWDQCFRPYWNSFDKVDGDVITGAPFTVHGNDGLIQSVAGKQTTIHQWPKISGSLEIVGGQAGRQAATSRMRQQGTNAQPITVADSDIRAQGGPGFLYTSQEVADTTPIGQFKEIRRNARPDQLCRFRGATQVSLYGDDVYVRSPHTPRGYNGGNASWCAPVSDRLWGLTRTYWGTEVTSIEAANNAALKPGDPSTWVKLENVPTDAVFVVDRLPPGEQCNTSVVRDNDGIGNRNGIGYPANRNDSDPLVGTSLDPYDCANGDLFIDGLAARRKTFTAEDNIYLTGAIRYSDRYMDGPDRNKIPENSDDLLGLVAQRNVFIYNPPSRQCTHAATEVCYRYPRIPFALPMSRSELQPQVPGGPRLHQGPWSASELKRWLRIGQEVGPADQWAFRTRIPTVQSWITMPQWDAVIVAETGAFLLENPLMHNRPTIIDRSGYSEALAATVTGAVYSRYAPVLHIDYETPSGEVKMHGLHARYINDPRLERALPPGFSGLSATSYRLQGFAEVASDLHLDADTERTP